MNKIEFFTIVLNGMPYIKQHIDVFDKLDIDWNWHIVEGVANLTHDTAWSRINGAYIPKQFYNDKFLSIDGTTEYIDSISNHSKVKVYRKYDIWDGKIEMIKCPLQNMSKNEHTILFQIDVDEIWTVNNINQIVKMYDNNPTANNAYYHCNYFLGKNKVVISDNTYGTGYDHWCRTWRLYENSEWISHEPPILSNNNQSVTIDRSYTKELGIYFDHYAYATRESVEFKEFYYGYKDAVSKWEQLQKTTGKVDASKYLDWIKPYGECIVDDRII